MEDAPHQIYTLLYQLSAEASRETDQILQEQLGIGLAQYRVLQCLLEDSALQQRHIAALLGQTEANISRQVQLLQRRGMVENMRNPLNRREHITSLTPRGERITEAAQKILETYHQNALSSMPPRQQVILLELLTKARI